MTPASRPAGARTRIAPLDCSSTADTADRLKKGSARSGIARNASQDALEFLERWTDAEPTIVDAILADRVFVPPGPLLEHRDGATQRTAGLEETEQQHGIAKIGQIGTRLHRADQPMLRQREDRDHAAVIEIGQHLMHQQQHELLRRYGILVAAETVQHDDAHAVALDMSR